MKLRQFFIVFAVLMISLGMSPAVRAQSNQTMQKSVSDLMLVAGFGTGGAVLGLSTLPFYSEPGDHLKNILIGGAVGIIVGVGWVMVGQATESRADYSKTSELRPTEFQEFLSKSHNWRAQQGIQSSGPVPLWWQGQILTF